MRAIIQVVKPKLTMDSLKLFLRQYGRSYNYVKDCCQSRCESTRFSFFFSFTFHSVEKLELKNCLNFVLNECIETTQTI